MFAEMPQADFTLRLVKHSGDLQKLAERLMSLPVFALDIETAGWWNRHRERITLIQIAYRVENQIRIVIIDAFADLDLEILRRPLEHSFVLKIIHNANFDAVRLREHHGFNVLPIFDTMTAVRRNGERRYSLKTQAENHLNLYLDKSARHSDWSRRPLDARQLRYAALDPYATLLPYEHQTKRGLTGDYRLRWLAGSNQDSLPLDEAVPISDGKPSIKESSPPIELSAIATTLLGIINELPSRYSPDGIAASVGSERIGLAGWIVDQRLGKDAEPDEETVKLTIADLCELDLIRITETRQLEATEAGMRFWKRVKY